VCPGLEAGAEVRRHWGLSRAVGAGLAVGGLAFATGGVIGAHDAKHVVDQLCYVITGCLTGLFLVVVGAALLVADEIRDNWVALDGLAERLESHRVSTPAAHGEAAPAGVPTGNGRPARTRRSIPARAVTS
jgi:hypothetical protein